MSDTTTKPEVTSDPTNKPSELALAIMEIVYGFRAASAVADLPAEAWQTTVDKIDALLAAHRILTPAEAKTIREAMSMGLICTKVLADTKPGSGSSAAWVSCIESALALLPVPAGEGEGTKP